MLPRPQPVQKITNHACYIEYRTRLQFQQDPDHETSKQYLGMGGVIQDSNIMGDFSQSQRNVQPFKCL